MDPDFKVHCSTKVKKKYGQKVLNEVESYINTSGELKPGQVAVTSAGKSKAKAVYHVFLPKSGSIMVRKCIVFKCDPVLKTILKA